MRAPRLVLVRPLTPTLSATAFEIQDVGFNACLQIANTLQIHVLPSPDSRLRVCARVSPFAHAHVHVHTLIIYQPGRCWAGGLIVITFATTSTTAVATPRTIFTTQGSPNL